MIDLAGGRRPPDLSFFFEMPPHGQAAINLAAGGLRPQGHPYFLGHPGGYEHYGLFVVHNQLPKWVRTLSLFVVRCLICLFVACVTCQCCVMCLFFVCVMCLF